MEHQDKNLKKRILEWLETQGYPLELEVAQAFQKEGFTVSVSDWYKDFDSGEMREIDVTALKWSNTDKPQSLQVCFRIECKAAHNKPWIIFLSKSQPDNYIPFKLMVTDEYRSFLTDVLTKNEDTRSRIKSLPLLRSHLAGHSVTQAYTSGQDIPYKAVTSSIKASIDRVIGLQEIQNRNYYQKMIFIIFGV